MDTPLWTPSSHQRDTCQMAVFAARASQLSGKNLSQYSALHAWSIEQRADFWRLLWDFTQIQASREATVVLGHDGLPGARWFEGARLNFAQNLLRFSDDRTALRWVGEDDSTERLSYTELHDQVRRFAHFLRSRGVQTGDRVAAFMPNRVESVIAMLATSSVGAVWSSCSPDFGFRGALDRFEQISPKIVLCANGYRYNGREHDSIQRAAQICQSIQSVECVVVISMLDRPADLSPFQCAVRWDDAIAEQGPPLIFEQLPFDHPLYIMYSSGTTGAPKCIVHGQGGTLLQHVKELVLHSDIQRSDRVFYFTTCGWMMWNWLISALFTGAEVVLYDGSPSFPKPDRLWSLAEDLQLTVFGTSPKFLSFCKKSGVRPGQQHDLSALRLLLSTGAPLSSDLFEWTYEAVSPTLQLASICGGTDILSCFMLGSPLDPVYAGEIQRPGLGMAVAAFNDDGRAVFDQKGELVCTMAFPSAPIGFWNDPQNQKYHGAYFSRFPGVWHHGDYIEVSPRGGVIVYGRSDATLNPGGVRIGTAEIDRQVDSFDEVEESIVIGHPEHDDISVVLFVVLREGLTLDEALKSRIRAQIRANATPRHVPRRIIQAPAIPRTLSGKKVELAVTRLLQGNEPTNTDALINPSSLNFFRTLSLQELP